MLGYSIACLCTQGDVIAYLVILFSGIFNAYTIIDKFAIKGTKARQKDICYDFTLVWLARGEFFLVCVAALRMIWLSARTTLKVCEQNVRLVVGARNYRVRDRSFDPVTNRHFAQATSPLCRRNVAPSTGALGMLGCAMHGQRLTVPYGQFEDY